MYHNITAILPQVKNTKSAFYVLYDLQHTTQAGIKQEALL
jgi:hypothetical protein